MLKKRDHHFDHTRDEIVATNTTEQECLGILSRKQFFENLVENVSKANENLVQATTPAAVEEALTTLEVLITSYSETPYVDEYFAEKIQEILTVMEKVHLHTLARSCLADHLFYFIKDAKKVIAEEEKKERSEMIQMLLLEMSEHAPEIADLIDIDKIFKNLN